jgi:hypothetical protein
MPGGAKSGLASLPRPLGPLPVMPSVGSRYAEVRTSSSAVIAAVFAGGSITTSLWPMTGRFGLGNLSRRTSGFRRSCRLSSLVIRQKAKARGLTHRTGHADRPHPACMGLSLSRGITPFLSSLSPCHSILLFDPRREHSSAPTAYLHRRRAQRRSRTALLQRRRRLVLDGREHGGKLPAIGRLGAR